MKRTRPKPPPPLSPEEFRALSGVSDRVLGKLEIYAALLEKWQPTVNLVAKTSLRDLWRRHMLDSVQLVALVPETADTLVDIGSGAGFPGLVLAIALEGKGPKVHLVESDQRKSAFLGEVNRETAAGAVIHNIRIENLRDFQADVVVARAVARLEKLLNLAFPLLKQGGQCLFLKGGKWREELTESQKNWIIKNSVIRSMSDSSGAILKLEALTHRDHS